MLHELAACALQCVVHGPLPHPELAGALVVRAVVGRHCERSALERGERELRSSAGANFALSMMLRHPEAVSRAVLHEAVLVRLFDDPEARARVTALVREAMRAGGAPAALEWLWRYVAGDENWERLEPGLRERMAASAETFFAAVTL